MSKKDNEVYALYKGDNWICDGTLEEIAEYTEKELKRLKYLSCPSVRQRNSKSGQYLEPIKNESQCDHIAVSPIEFAGVRGAVCDECGKWL